MRDFMGAQKSIKRVWVVSFATQQSDQQQPLYKLLDVRLASELRQQCLSHAGFGMLAKTLFYKLILQILRYKRYRNACIKISF